MQTCSVYRPLEEGERKMTEAADMNLIGAECGQRYHLSDLGKTRSDRLEMLAAGLSEGSVIQIISGEGRRPRVVACGEIRAAIGHDLAERVGIRRCGCGCGCGKRET